MQQESTFFELDAWHNSRDIAKEIYIVTSKPEFEQDWSLRDQMRRAAVSVCSNMAEGYERDGDRELIRFLHIAKGSAGELLAQIHIAFDINYLDETEFEQLKKKMLDELALLGGLIRYVKKRQS